LSQADVERFAREDPKIKRHIDVVRRKELLEHVLKEMDGLRQLESRVGARGFKRTASDQRGSKGWGIF
jgi:hypothetical protein